MFVFDVVLGVPSNVCNSLTFVDDARQVVFVSMMPSRLSVHVVLARVVVSVLEIALDNELPLAAILALPPDGITSMLDRIVGPELDSQHIAQVPPPSTYAHQPHPSA